MLVLVPASAFAKATLVAPADESKLASSTPVYSWTMAPGERDANVSVFAVTYNADGKMQLTAFDNKAVPDGTATWTPAQRYFAGGYVWSVSTTDGSNAAVESDPFVFFVPEVVKPVKLLVKPVQKRKQLRVNMYVKTNAEFFHVTAKVWIGGKLWYKETTRGDDPFALRRSAVMLPIAPGFVSERKPARTLPRRTKVKVQMTVAGEVRSATLTRTFVV